MSHNFHMSALRKGSNHEHVSSYDSSVWLISYSSVHQIAANPHTKEVEQGREKPLSKWVDMHLPLGLIRLTSFVCLLSNTLFSKSTFKSKSNIPHSPVKSSTNDPTGYFRTSTTKRSYQKQRQKKQTTATSMSSLTSHYQVSTEISYWKL